MSTALVLLLLAGCSTSPPGGNEPGGGTDGTDTSTGDHTGDPVDSGTPDDGLSPTWYGDLQPIVMENCGGCHFTGSDNAGTAFDTYQGASAYAGLMLAKIVGDVNVPYNMPPFPPPDQDTQCSIPGPIRNDTRLSSDEQAMFAAWVEAGMPEGDPATAAPYTMQDPPVLAGADVVGFPGVHTTVPAIDYSTEGEIDYDYAHCNSIEVTGDVEMLINALQVVQDPLSNGFVHHVIVATDPGGVSYTGADGGDPHDGEFHKCETDMIPDSSMLFTYTPGGFPLYFPDDSAMLLPPHSRLLYTVHYHKQPTTFTDNSTLTLRTLDEPPTYMAYMSRFGAGSRTQADWSYQERGTDGGWDLEALDDQHDFPYLLHAGDPDYRMTWKEDNDFAGDYRVWGVFPDLHFAGKSIRIGFEHADETETCLASIDPFDFDWQLTYIYDLPYEEMPLFSRDDRAKVECVYDNSWDNQRLSDGLAGSGFTDLFDMVIGENTFDEMCVMHYGMLVPWGEAMESDQ